jgi:hypothetical protein
MFIPMVILGNLWLASRRAINRGLSDGRLEHAEEVLEQAAA